MSTGIDLDRLEKAVWAYLRTPWYIDIDRTSDEAVVRDIVEELVKLYDEDDTAVEVHHAGP